MALLEIKNLVKNYGDVEALKGISLSVEKGEVVVILGPSGCGKSTFLRTLNGLEPIKSGQLLLQNAGILGKDISWVKARQRIGMVFQSYELFAHLSVIDNILLGPLMKVWFVTIVRPIMDVLKQPSLFCVVVWKPSLQISTQSRLPLRT